MSVRFDEQGFIKAMREVVEERGADYIYPKDTNATRASGWRTPTGTCVYTLPSGEPACIVGAALAKIGLKPSANANAAVVLEYEMRASGRVASAASDAQDEQDGGAPWGQALAAFESRLEEY